MKTPTTKHMMRRLALTLSLALALGATGGAWAATDTGWTGGSGGTEAAPLEFYNADNWASGAFPSSSYNMVFPAGTQVVLTNNYADAATKQVSGDIKPEAGTYTFLGSYIFPTFNAPSTAAGTLSIVKKGDWKLSYAAYIGEKSDSHVTFTNVWGNIEHTNSGKWFEIADYGTCVFENLSGNWTIAGHLSIAQNKGGRGELYWRGGNLTHTDTANPFYVARGENTVAIVEKDAGDWTISNYVVLAGGYGKNPTATFKHNGGTMTVNGSDIRLCDKSDSTTGGASFELVGGTVSAKLIQHGAGTAPATLTFNGGTFKALAAGTVVSNSNYLVVNATATGGTMDANGKAIEIEEAIEDASGETGKMTFAGGGSVTLTAQPTYTGVTTVELGTALVVPSAIAGNKLAFTIPEGTADGVYEVVRISGGGAFAADVLDDASLPSDANANFFLNSAKTGIYCLYGEISGDGKVWVGIAGDGKLSSVENWLDTTAPANGDVLNFSAATGAISLDADLGAVVPSTLVLGSKVVSISSGSLTVDTLTNACTLAVASGASLTVTGDMVVRCDETNGTMPFLYSNEGTVRIGRAVCTTANDGKATTTKQYEVVTANTQPIRTGGFLFDRVDNRVYWRLESGNSAPGAWVVGANGFAYGNIVNEKQMRYFVQNSPVTLYSSADWTLSGCGQKSATFGELHVYDGSASLTIDTSDYDDPTVSRVVTLEGRLVAEKPVTIKGCGTVQVNTTGAHPELPADLQHTCISNTTLSVTDSATLKINEGRKITGNGTVSLAAGTTLVLPSDVIAAGEKSIPGLALPETGTVTLRFDGPRLRSGDHVLLDSVPDNYANLVVDRSCSAIDGRRVAVVEKDGNLVLNITGVGLKVVFR